MEQNKDTTKEVSMEITSNKIAKQEKRFEIIEEQLKAFADNKVMLAEAIHSIELWKKEIIKSTISIEVFELFSSRLNKNNHLLEQTAKTKVQHHHHIPKLIWITAGLFISLALALSGWYATSQKANEFIANDTRCRYLKLDTTQYLQVYLYRVDSLYKTMPDMRKYVFEEEKRLQKNFEKLQKAKKLRGEAKGLEKEVMGYGKSLFNL